MHSYQIAFISMWKHFTNLVCVFEEESAVDGKMFVDVIAIAIPLALPWSSSSLIDALHRLYQLYITWSHQNTKIRRKIYPFEVLSVNA